MSACHHSHTNSSTDAPILREGLRLFFPASALHGAIWPLLWVALYGLDLPFASQIPSSQWHAHEMIYGTYAMALAGFLTSAIPEWTDTPPRRGMALLLLLFLWLPGRFIGLFGIDVLSPVAGLTDTAFLGVLGWYILKPLIVRRSTQGSSFFIWTILFAITEVAIRVSWFFENYDLSHRFLLVAICIFMVFFTLSVARIGVAIINRTLDPSGETTPYRPHPGRQNLAAGLVALYAVLMLAFPDSLAPAYLALATGAAFMDRLTEWFIGRSILKMQILVLALANLFAGLGFFVIGIGDLGGSAGDIVFMATTGVHILTIGSLGMAIMAVFTIAGLLHTGHDLDLPWQAHAAIIAMIFAALVRIIPEMGIATELYGFHYVLSALLWSGSFALWLSAFLPMMRSPSSSMLSVNNN